MDIYRIDTESVRRAFRAACDPGTCQCAEFGLCTRRRRAARSGVPAPTDQPFMGVMRRYLPQRLAAVAGAVLELPADLAERLAFPRHRSRREVPVRMARHAARAAHEGDVARAVRLRAFEARCAVPVRAARHRGLVRLLVVALVRPVASRGAVDAARVPDNVD